MNRIYWDTDSIGILTDHIDAASHSHPTLQLFLSIENFLDIEVSNEILTCRCVIVNKNVPHAFDARQRLHFSLIIEPTSKLAEQLYQKMNGANYFIYDDAEIEGVQRQAKQLIQNHSTDGYRVFVECFFTFLEVEPQIAVYDDRVIELLELLNDCSCDDHAISKFADKVALSKSRLSHLFKEQIGISLKSYIMLHQIEQAFILLLEGENVTEAAMKAGFDTPSHFAATTKRLMGMSASTSLKDSEFLKVSEF